MTVEIISRSISMKVWDRSGIKLITPGSVVRHVSAARHITNCAMWPVGGVKLVLTCMHHLEKTLNLLQRD